MHAKMVTIKDRNGMDLIEAPRPGSPVPSTPERREGLRACYWEGSSELPERRSSSSAPRRDSAILKAKKIKIVTVSNVFPIYFP